MKERYLAEDNVAADIIYCVLELLKCTDNELDYMDFITDQEFYERYQHEH